MKIVELLEDNVADAKKYIEPMFKKWQETLKATAAAGANTSDPEKQKEVLAFVIGNYARLSNSQIQSIYKKIQSSDLRNNAQVRDIITQAVALTLANRGLSLDLVEPSVTSPPAPSQPANQISSGARARAQGNVYVWTGSNWRNMANGQVAPPNLAAILTKQFS